MFQSRVTKEDIFQGGEFHAIFSDKSVTNLLKMGVTELSLQYFNPQC